MNGLVRAAAIAAGALMLGACQYTASVAPAPSYSVVSNFGDKIAGKFLLYVSASALDIVARPVGLSCSAHSFPISMSRSFAESVRATLANVVEAIEVVATPVPSAELAQRGARGMIVVTGESLRSRLGEVDGAFTSTSTGDIQIVASIAVDGRKGRLLGATVDGDGKAENGAGFMCEGGAKALGMAAEDAMQQAVRKLGEALANSDRVRAGA
jgi:hypothetical protein